MHKVLTSRSLVLIASSLTVAAALAQTPSPECRTFTTDEVRTVTGATSGTISQTCRWDAAATSRICNMRTRLSNTSFEVTYTDKYASVADFIDEIRVIPPISRIQSQSRRYLSGSGPTGELRYEYDSNRRQTRITASMSSGQVVTSYTAWDAKGRPTAATVSGGAPFQLSYKYDDVLRTMATSGPVGVQRDTYDADGNMIREEATDGHGVTNYVWKINKTEKVCKG